MFILNKSRSQKGSNEGMKKLGMEALYVLFLVGVLKVGSYVLDSD